MSDLLRPSGKLELPPPTVLIEGVEVNLKPLGVGPKTRKAIADIIANKFAPGDGWRVEALQEALLEEHGIDFPVNT